MGHNCITDSCRKKGLFLPQKQILLLQLKISVSIFRKTYWTIKTKLSSSHKKIWWKIVFHSNADIFTQLKEIVIYQLPERKIYALASFIKSTRCLFQNWRGEAKLLFIVLVFNITCFLCFCPELGKMQMQFTVYMAHATPWSPWKALEFNIWFQGRLKSPWKEEVLVKVLENNGNSLNFFGMGNSKGYIKNWAHMISNLQNDFSKNFCSTCTFACWVKSDLRTLCSGINFSMSSFSVASAKLWNALPLDIRTSDNLLQFKHNLKAHLFRKAFY